jgi:hypothetical protein
MKKHTLLALLLCASFMLHAQIINVPAGYPTIQQGIDASGNGDTVLVAPGIYFEIISFNGKNITVASYFLTTQDTSYISQTVIDGCGSGIVVKFISGEDSTACLMGFSIRNGYNTNTSEPGAGISIQNSHPAISDLIITDNIAKGYVSIYFNSPNYGAGIFCYNSSSKISNIQIVNNKVIIYGSGGGIYCSNANIILDNVTIEGNSPQGLVLVQSDVSMTDVTLSGNTDCGLYCQGSNPVLNDVTIAGNTGYGLYCYDANPVLNDVRITGNTDCGLYCQDSNPVLKNVTITKNHNHGLWCMNSSPVFDYDDRCNIYANNGVQGWDLYSDLPVNIVLDTFTVFNPTPDFATPFENFTFDIIHGLVEQVNANLYVSPSGDDSNSGLLPDEPVKTIHHALIRMIADSLNPSTIYLDKGIYNRSATGDIFPLIFHPYISLSGISRDSVIIDSEGIGPVIHVENIENFLLADLTVSGGNSEQRGGLYVKSSSLILNNVAIKNNLSKYGGGIYLVGENEITMANSIINSNKNGITNAGEVILNLENVTISNNYGTGISNAGNLHLYGTGSVSIRDNGSVYGGIYCSSGYTYMNNIKVSGSEDGIRCFENGSPWPTLILENSSVSQNSGSGIYALRAYLTLNNVNVYGNNGGGIRCGMTGLIMRNCCLSDNSADQGAGLYMGSGNANLFNVTITGNTAGSYGGVYASSSSHIKMVNCISYFNSPDEISSNFNITYSNIYGGYEGLGNIDSDPLFEGSFCHPYQLAAGSPCVEAGRPDISALGLPEYDLIGNYRLWDGDMDGDTVVDMGAYEFGSVGVKTPEFQVPGSGFQVEVFPNPFSEMVHIEYEIENPSHIELKIFNAVGDMVAVLWDLFSSER